MTQTFIFSEDFDNRRGRMCINDLVELGCIQKELTEFRSIVVGADLLTLLKLSTDLLTNKTELLDQLVILVNEVKTEHNLEITVVMPTTTFSDVLIQYL